MKKHILVLLAIISTWGLLQTNSLYGKEIIRLVTTDSAAIKYIDSKISNVDSAINNSAPLSDLDRHFMYYMYNLSDDPEAVAYCAAYGTEQVKRIKNWLTKNGNRVSMDLIDDVRNFYKHYAYQGITMSSLIDMSTKGLNMMKFEEISRRKINRRLSNDSVEVVVINLNEPHSNKQQSPYEYALNNIRKLERKFLSTDSIPDVQSIFVIDPLLKKFLLLTQLISGIQLYNPSCPTLDWRQLNSLRDWWWLNQATVPISVIHKMDELWESELLETHEFNETSITSQPLEAFIDQLRQIPTNSLILQ